MLAVAQTNIVFGRKLAYLERLVSENELLMILQYVKAKVGKYPYSAITLTTRKILRFHGLPIDISNATRVSWALRWLEALGYLTQVSKKPTPHFRLTARCIQWALTCSYPQCINDGSVCGLYGFCPIHKLLEVRRQ